MQIDKGTHYCAYHEEMAKLNLREVSFEELQAEVERIKKIPCVCGLPDTDTPDKVEYDWGTYNN